MQNYFLGINIIIDKIFSCIPTKMQYFTLAMV